MERRNEIRINDTYTSFLTSEYPKSTSDESIPKGRVKNVRTNNWLEKLKNHLTPEDQTDTLLPPNCRLVRHYPQGSIVVVEEQPAMRSIRVTMDMTRDAETLKTKGLWEKYGYTDDWFNENKKPYIFNLATPYVIHIMLITKSVCFNRGSMFFRPKPLMGIGDTLFKAPFLNISSDQNVCYGETASKGPHTSIGREIDHVIRVFWSASFNPDYIHNYSAYEQVPALCDYFTWQYYSETNPMFIYNADWVPWDLNLLEVIQNYENNNSLGEDRPFYFKTLEEMFSKPEMSTRKVKVGKRTREVERNLIFDFCNGYVIDQDLTIYVGDPIMYREDKVAYIDSFVGVQGLRNARYIRMQIDDVEKLPLLKLTKKALKFLVDKTKEIRHEAFIKVGDVKYRAGDIISRKNIFGNEIYQKIRYIRKTNDDRIEMRIGSEYMFVDAFEWDKVKKLDMSKPEIDGEKIEKDVEYIYFTGNHWNPSPQAKVTPVKFFEITTSSNKLFGKFRETVVSQQTYNINLSSNQQRPKALYHKEEFEPLEHDVFYIGRTLLRSYKNMTETYDDKVYRHKDLGIVSSIYNRVSTNDHPYHSTFEKLVNEDGTAFHIESNNHTTHFEIGDKVIVANWMDPLDVLKIKTITAFVKNEDRGTFDFVLQDKHGTPSVVNYIEPYGGVIRSGYLRKVTNELNGISIGTKIIAEKGRTICFPKKDVNIIVAFIIDTGGEPLVLCSNGCTLWFTDLTEKFKMIPMKSPKWKNLQHVPLDPTKIKLQAGDIVNGVNFHKSPHGYLLVKTGGIGVRVNRLNYYHDFEEYMSISSTFFDDMVLDCIPNPRIGPKDQKEMGAVSAFPNFHGGLTETVENFSPYKLLNETGRFTDVSSVRE